jgi:hypothetical protein
MSTAPVLVGSDQLGAGTSARDGAVFWRAKNARRGNHFFHRKFDFFGSCASQRRRCREHSADTVGGFHHLCHKKLDQEIEAIG